MEMEHVKIFKLPWYFLAICLWGWASLSWAAQTDFELNEQCPASFERVDGHCLLRSLYQLYRSPAGYGGLRVSLPKVRDGFTPQEIDLGRYLFFDPLLSDDKLTSCASCHVPALGFSDGQPRSRGQGAIGIGKHRRGGIDLSRAAPSLWNVGFLPTLFWDARASSLEEQAEGPLFSAEEMNNNPEQLLESLNNNASYKRLFTQAFHEIGSQKKSKDITLNQVTRALTAFQSSLISLNSPYDRYAHGDKTALNDKEIQGHNIFRSFVARCTQCHTPPLFTNAEVAVIGAPEPDGRTLDPGAQAIVGHKSLRGGFKVPTLRNIAKTAPYMHSGVFSTLDEVVDFYNKRRGHAVPPGESLSVHWHLLEPDLSATELAALVAFLQTLTDESMAPRTPDNVPSGLPVPSAFITNSALTR
jgi:cytochrome c peroxidase